jgi:hypothetical protein
MILPPEALPLLAALAPAFTRPTYRRFITLLLAAILTTGRRTVANLLRTLGGLAPGHRTDYQRGPLPRPLVGPGPRLCSGGVPPPPSRPRRDRRPGR